MKTVLFKSGLAALTAGVLLGTSVSALSQPPPQSGPDRRGLPGDGPRAERPFAQGAGAAMAGRFGPGLFQAFAVLNPEQRESLRELLGKDREKLSGSEEKLRDARRELVKAALAEKFNEKAVRKHAKEIAKIEADRTVALAKALAKVEPPLTPEQKERLQNPPPPGQFGQERRQFRRQGALPQNGERPIRPQQGDRE